jgi:hypothetical protein
VVGSAIVLQPELGKSLEAQLSAGEGATYLPFALLGAVAAGLAAALMRNSWVSPFLEIRLWLGPVALLVLSFVLAGISFYIVISAVTAAGAVPLGTAIATYAFAWAAGFVVPGAPAGLGVREAVLVALLGPLIGAPAALVSAILHRLLSAVADGSMAAVGAGLLYREKKDG